LKTAIHKAFVGFFHNAPEHPENVLPKYSAVKSIRRILESKEWEKSKSHCRGLFVMSEYLAAYLRKHTDLKISVLKHPTAPPKEKFTFAGFANNKNQKALCVGHWMRNLHTFFRVPSKRLQKYWLTGGAIEEDLKLAEELATQYPGVQSLKRVPNWEYDYLLSENIVFTPLYDASANNVVVECIVRNTPILINKLPAITEYLGAEYPFYFENEEEAAEKIDNFDLIKATTDYLQQLDKEALAIEKFLENFIASEVYQSLPPNRIGLM